MHRSWAPHLCGHYISFCGAWYFCARSTERDSNHPCGTWNFEVGLRILEGFSTPGTLSETCWCLIVKYGTWGGGVTSDKVTKVSSNSVTPVSWPYSTADTTVRLPCSWRIVNLPALLSIEGTALDYVRLSVHNCSYKFTYSFCVHVAIFGCCAYFARIKIQLCKAYH